MKRLTLLLTFLALAAFACGPVETPPPFDIHAVETIAAATLTAIAPTQSPPTLVPVATLTFVPSQSPPATLTPITPSAPTRIQFEPGGISATVQSTVTFPNRVEYILTAMKNQRMTVALDSADATVNFLVFGLSDHSTLKRFETEERVWNGTLPATQDYLISVAIRNGSADFTLTVTIVWP